jgi:hypothetical protein
LPPPPPKKNPPAICSEDMLVSVDLSRARFIRAFLFPAPGEEAGPLQQLAKKVFLAAKPPPTIESKFKNRWLRCTRNSLLCYLIFVSFTYYWCTFHSVLRVQTILILVRIRLFSLIRIRIRRFSFIRILTISNNTRLSGEKGTVFHWFFLLPHYFLFYRCQHFFC